MSGRTKRILYTVFMTVTGLVAVAGTILVGFFGVIQDVDQTLGCSIALVIFALFCIFLPPNVLIHECGHLCFGVRFPSANFKTGTSAFRQASGCWRSADVAAERK